VRQLLGLRSTHASATALRATGNRLLRLSLGRSRVMVALFGAVTLVGVAATVGMPGVLAAAIDAVGDRERLHRLLVLLAAVFAVITAAAALEGLLGSYWGSHVTAWLRHRLVARALVLGVPGQHRFPPGELLSRLTENAASPAGFLPLFVSAAATLLTAIGAVLALMLIDLWLGLVFLAGVVPAVILLRRFVTQASEPFLRYQQLLAAILTRLMDARRGIRTIRASGTLERDVERILLPLPELHRTGEQMWAVQRQVSWQLSLLAPVLQVLVLSVGGFLLTAGAITPGQLVAAAAYAGMALGAVGLFDALVALLGCQVGAGRVGEVLEATPTVAPPAQPVVPSPGPGRVELRGLGVRLEGRVVLDRLDLSIPPGASLAVVGGSGTGKTVLTSLIGRLLDPDEGQVLLDGHPVDRLELAALRRTVTYAFERPALLGTTVHDMISYGRPEASRSEVMAAAVAAQADRFIRSLPDGYDTALACAPMSGGELQRLGLARAVLADARVVVLDDATSSLDTATEVRVVEALERVLAGRTCVVVAHRATTAARMDLVAWLDAGRVRALAPHRVLWADPCYRAIFAADGPTAAGNGVDPAAATAAVVRS